MTADEMRANAHRWRELREALRDGTLADLDQGAEDAVEAADAAEMARMAEARRWAAVRRSANLRTAHDRSEGTDAEVVELWPQAAEGNR